MTITRETTIAGLLGIVCSMAACSLSATMMPVEGPLSLLKPVPTLKVRATGIWGNSGDLRFSMPDGEACAGRWASAAGSDVTFAAGSLLSQYGSAYITGYSVSSGGRNVGQALAACSRGRSFQLEFVSGDGAGYGIGKDNEGNIYRFVF